MSLVRIIAFPALHSSGIGCITRRRCRVFCQKRPSWTRQVVGRRYGKSPGRQFVNCF